MMALVIEMKQWSTLFSALNYQDTYYLSNWKGLEIITGERKLSAKVLQIARIRDKGWVSNHRSVKNERMLRGKKYNLHQGVH